MRIDVKRDFDFQDELIPTMCQIVGKELAPFLFERAPEEADMRENTDLIILAARDIRVACRLRREEYARRYPYDITMRASRVSGADTEIHKFLNGFGRAFFYGFVGRSQSIEAWRLLSLNRLRGFFAEFDRSNSWRADDLIAFAQARGLVRCGHKFNGDGTTTFVYFDVRELAAKVPGVMVASFPPIGAHVEPVRPAPFVDGLPLFDFLQR